MQTSFVGKRGEEIAAHFLKKKGFSILETNFHSRVGEIDIIAKSSETLVFVEVKTRTGKSFGTPAEAVTAKKLHAIISTAYYYLQMKNRKEENIRVDVIEVIKETTGEITINHLENVTL